jgi:hypothetical protein
MWPRGRTDIGGGAGAGSAGFGGATSYTESHTGICLQLPDPLHIHSQVQLAWAAGAPIASATAASIGPFLMAFLLFGTGRPGAPIVHPGRLPCTGLSRCCPRTSGM